MFAVDEDRAAGHAALAAAIGRADQVSGAAAHVNQSAVHFAAEPIAGIAFDVNFAAGHFAADVPPGVARDVDRALAHVRADPMHAGQVALELHAPVAGVARDIEELGQRPFLVAVKDLETFDLGQRLPAHGAGHEPFDLDRDGRFGVVDEGSMVDSSR